MDGNQAVLFNNPSFKPGPTDRVLWWLATAEPELIQHCVVDRNRYRVVGLSVLATWLFATLAWTYFFSTATQSVPAYLLLGLFMGFVILTIDRTLIKGINKNNRGKMVPLLFRGLMAIAIGTFMAQPAILYLFDKDVRLQTSLDNEGRKIEKRHELDSLYSGQKQVLASQINILEQSLTAKYAEVGNARSNFLAETDGSGGSGKLGISTIALAKKAEYQKLENEYGGLRQNMQPKIDSLQGQLGKMETTITQEEARFAALLNDGFLTRIQALQNLLKNNDALALRYYLVVAILMLIELMPVIAKTLLPSGAYDEKVQQQEAVEKDLAIQAANNERELKQYYNNAVLQAGKQAVDDLFEAQANRRHQQTDHLIKKWSEDDQHSFDNLWQRLRRKLIGKWDF